MSLLCFSAQVYFFVFSLSATATPIYDGVTSTIAGVSHRRWIQAQLTARGNPTVQNVTNVALFNPENVTKELNGIKAKFANAGKVLAGVGLNPETHPERGYPKFNPPNFLLSEASSSESAAGIIGVPPVAPGSGAVQMPLTDEISGSLDILYYGPMHFGNNQTKMQIDVDTGSADLWVPVQCRNCDQEQYDTGQSSTYVGSKNKCKIVYGTGQVVGTLAQDSVSVGPIGVDKQTFCAVHKVSEDLNQEPNSGLLGLAFGSIAQSGKPTFFENLLAEKKLSASIFSVHLTRLRERGSEVCFGCFDPTRAVGPVVWNPVISRTYWSIAMNGLSVNGTESPPANLTAAVDTGTSLIYLPTDVATDFYGLIPGSATAVQYGAGTRPISYLYACLAGLITRILGFYTFPCDTPFSVSLILGGQAYSVHPTDFNLGRTDDDSDNCVGGILALGNGFPPDLAIIGDEFLKSWYSVFDYSGRVGFAPSVNNK
ncbi:acid protease [Cubamyces lactineus]|nr:acid protease [Cubamyces lactineus]